MSDTVARIFALMERDQITAYRLAAGTGISQARISSWKNGKSNPKQDALERIADYFHVTVDYLVGRTDVPDGYGIVAANREGYELTGLTAEEKEELTEYLLFLRTRRQKNG